MSVVYGPVDQAVRQWLLSTPVAPLVQRGDGGYSLYLSMPSAAPVPALTVRLVGGGPRDGKDLPEGRYRLSFDCWGTTRDQAGQVALTLISQLLALGCDYDGPTLAGTTLGAASVLGFRWLPDPESDEARYVVDALITTVT